MFLKGNDMNRDEANEIAQFLGAKLKEQISAQEVKEKNSQGVGMYDIAVKEDIALVPGEGGFIPGYAVHLSVYHETDRLGYRVLTVPCRCEIVQAYARAHLLVEEILSRYGRTTSCSVEGGQIYANE